MTFLWPCSNLGIAHPCGETPQARAQADIFKRLGTFTRRGRAYSEMKSRFDMSSQQVETRVALFQELGLLYKVAGSDELRLTQVGSQLLNLLLSAATYGDRECTQATAVVAWALSNSQIRRPHSPGSPRLTPQEREACDIRPCAAAWSMILDLDGILYMHEFLGPIRALQRVEDYDRCLDQIRRARRRGTIFVDPTQWASGAPLMNPAIYWRSRLSVAGRLLEFEDASQAFEFAPGGENLVLAIVEAQEQDGAADLSFLAASPWSDADDYYRFAGRACPAAVAGLFAEADLPPEEPAAVAGHGRGRRAQAPPPSSAEGQRQYRRQSYIERNSALSREAKRLNAQRYAGRITCESCDFGHADTAMLDAHHQRPLADGIRDTRVEDLRILCPTCHRRAHRSANRLEPFSIAELQAWVAAGRP